MELCTASLQLHADHSGEAQADGRQAETETPIMTSTLWGFSCSLQRRSRRPQRRKNLVAIHGAKPGGSRWQKYWGFDSALRIRVGGKNKESWVAKLGKSRY